MAIGIRELACGVVFCVVGTLISPQAAPCQSRTETENAISVDQWSYARLTSVADLVAIGTLQAQRSGAYDLYRGDFVISKETLDVCVSTFDIAATLKGNCGGKTVEVVHVARRNIPMVDRSGMRFAEFSKSLKIPDLTKVMIGGEVIGFGDSIGSRTIRPEYLLFLKLRNDGRYELVPGDVNSQSSVRILNLE
jgi:hypothetical protein